MSLSARLFVVLFSILLSAGVAAKDALRIGVYSQYPPLAYHDKEGLAGIDIAAGEVLAKQLDRKPQFVEMPFGKLIPALLAGEVDIIMSGMTITAERSEQVAFSKPYLDAGQMAIIRFADAGRYGYKGVLFRPGARVAVQQGTTGESYARESLKEAQVTAFDTIDDGFRLLKSGQVDFLVHDAATSWALATDRDKEDLMSLNTPLTREQLGWAVRKDDQALLQAVNAQLTLMQKNGVLRAIIRKWIPVTVEVAGVQAPTSTTRVIRPTGAVSTAQKPSPARTTSTPSTSHQATGSKHP